MSYIDLTKTSAPATPATNHEEIFVDTADKRLKTIDDAGLIIKLTGNDTTDTLTNKTLTSPVLNGTLSGTAFGNLTDAGTDGITVTSGTGAVVGTGTSIAQHVADTTHNGYLDSTDWTTFNGKFGTAGRGLANTGSTVRVSPSTQTATASGGNVTPTSDTIDTVIITVDANATILAPSGTPVSGQKLMIIMHNDASHAMTFDTGASGKFRFGTTIASYTATASKVDYVGTVWNNTDSRWDIVSTSLGF